MAHISKNVTERSQGQTYQQADPATSGGIAKHIIDIACAAGVCARQKKDEVGREPKPGAKGFRVPAQGLDFFRQPEVEVHGIEHGADPLGEGLAPYQPLRSWRHGCGYLRKSISFGFGNAPRDALFGVAGGRSRSEAEDGRNFQSRRDA